MSRVYKKVIDGLVVGVSGINQGQGWVIADSDDNDVLEYNKIFTINQD